MAETSNDSIGIDHLLASATHSITASSPRYSLDGSFETSELSIGGHTAAEPSPPGSDASSATSDADDPAQAATPIQVADQLLGVGSGILQEPAAVAAEAEAISNQLLEEVGRVEDAAPDAATAFWEPAMDYLKATYVSHQPRRLLPGRGGPGRAHHL